MDETGDQKPKTKRPRRFRGPYHKKYSSVMHHLDWYLQVSLGKTPDANLPIESITKELKNETGIDFDAATIRKYNAQQFLKYEISPLARVSNSEYSLNNEYYRVMGGFVAEPGKAKMGRRRKSDYIKPPTSDVVVLTF